MSKVPLSDVNSRYGSVGALNANFDSIQQGFENTLSRDGTGPNAMESDLDMNGNDILNAASVSVTSLTINGQLVVPSGTVVAPLPGQAGQAGKYLYTNGSAASWRTLEYTPTGVGAVTRTVQERFQEVANVNDYGASPLGLTSASTAIQAVLNSGARFIEARGVYLLNTGLTLPAGVVFDCRNAVFLAGTNGMTMLTATNGIASQVLGGLWRGNSRTSVVAMDLTNMRQGAALSYPQWEDVATGVIVRAGCTGLVVDAPTSVRVPAPVRVLASSHSLAIRNPSFDNSSGVSGNNTGNGIEVVASEGVSVVGGAIQGFASGVLDNAVKTSIENVRFALCTTADVNTVGARAGHYRGNTHYGATGPTAYRLRSADAIIVDNPTMGTSARTGMFDADNTNTNCLTFLFGNSGSLNTPLGNTTGIIRSGTSIPFTIVDASSTVLWSSNWQNNYIVNGDWVHITGSGAIDFYPTSGGPSYVEIMLPIPRKNATPFNPLVMGQGAMVNTSASGGTSRMYTIIGNNPNTVIFYDAITGLTFNPLNIIFNRIFFSISYPWR
jgi:hypothetical protein